MGAYIGNAAADKIAVGNVESPSGYVGAVKVYPDFPSYLERVEYLESNGNQWITTPMMFKDNYHLEVDADFSVNGEGLFGMYVNYDAGFAVNSGEYYFYQNSSNYWPSGISAGERSTFIEDYATKTLTITNIMHSSSQVLNSITPVNSQWPLILFAVWSSYHGGVPYKSTGKIYSVKFESKDGNGNVTQIGNYIPARRRSDSVGGFWDSVSKTFLPNEGTQPFIFPS